MAISKKIEPENNLNGDWLELLKPELQKSYFGSLKEKLADEYNTQTIYPPYDKIFRAFELCPLNDVKVVILGQDPYHGRNQANGLAFSVNENCKIPPSLRNIFKELQSDIGKPLPKNGNIESWAKQGVLLLNTVLTVRAGEAASHRNMGWENFTKALIENISQKRSHLVFLLWGKAAQESQAFIHRTHSHLILKSAHPSPFSAARGFFGNKHFSKTNKFLKNHKRRIIIW